MIISLALALLVTAGGALATYLYDNDASLSTRLCTGACIGLAAFGLVGFVLASFLGFTPLAVAVSTVVVASPFTLLRDPTLREQVQVDLTATSRTIRRAIYHPTRDAVVYFLYYATASVLLWQIFNRAMIDLPDGIYTGVLNNFGDLPFHLSVITGFAYGNNFPPEDPTYAGVRFTYPFLTDFISAMFVRCGASLREAMFIENFLLTVSLVGVLHRWALEMLRDRIASLLTPLLVLLNGGFGWLLLFRDAGKNEGGMVGVLKHLPASFTVIPETTWRWGNAISALLVPQRGILLGLPLAVIVFTQWWLATSDAEPGRHGDAEKNDGGKRSRGDGGKVDSEGKPKKNRKLTARNEASDLRISRSPRPPVSRSLLVSPTTRMIAAGVVAGLLPLAHAHSFVVVMTMGSCIALIQRRWREWAAFILVASAIALPQMWWSTRGSAVSASSFFGWEFGWDHGNENALWFWFKNTGLLIPLTVAAIVWRGKEYLVPKRLLLFYLPFTLCFIVPNLLKLAPWVWDNIKVLFYWWVASAPLVALLLARLWRHGSAFRVLTVALFVCVTLAGALDVASIVTRSGDYQVFDRKGIQFAELVKAKTPARSLTIHAPVHNTPVFLTGRRSLMGYPGHIWTHGLEFAQREGEIRRIYSGAPDAESLLKKYGVDYAVVGPLEHTVMPVNDRFFSRFEKVGEVGEYRLYKVTQP